MKNKIQQTSLCVHLVGTTKQRNQNTVICIPLEGTSLRIKKLSRLPHPKLFLIIILLMELQYYYYETCICVFWDKSNE